MRSLEGKMGSAKLMRELWTTYKYEKYNDTQVGKFPKETHFSVSCTQRMMEETPMLGSTPFF